MAVIKVEPWGEDQGDFVYIEEENFDPNFHVMYDPDKKTEGKSHKKDGKKSHNEKH